MEIITLPISEIKPSAYNPRKDLQPGDSEYEKLKKSIVAFELVEPLIWNKRSGNLKMAALFVFSIDIIQTLCYFNLDTVKSDG